MAVVYNTTCVLLTTGTKKSKVTTIGHLDQNSLDLVLVVEPRTQSTCYYPLEPKQRRGKIVLLNSKESKKSASKKQDNALGCKCAGTES